jgi:hypothetical protein
LLFGSFVTVRFGFSKALQQNNQIIINIYKMPRTYRKVNDEMRFELIRQVHEDHFSIKEAAKNLEI